MTKQSHELAGKKQKHKSKRQYHTITNDQRLNLISLITVQGLNIVEASKQTGINYENAKAIYRVYRLEGRN